MRISFFAKRAFRCRGDGHLMRVSSMIRVDQPAAVIGAKINPASNYKNDVCIYVKPHVKPGHDFNFEGRAYLDIIDGWVLIDLLKKHPEVGVIACSDRDAITLAEVVKNKIVTIPQHHCNFERQKRSRKEITTVGVIGTAQAFPFLPAGLKSELSKRGMDLIEFSSFFSRTDIVDFYKKIDVQIVWRPYSKKLANPLKLVNAASFGIPTICLDEPYFKELSGCYFPVRHLAGFLKQLDDLRASSALYSEYSEKCLLASERYHIEKVAEIYRQLD